LHHQKIAGKAAAATAAATAGEAAAPGITENADSRKVAVNSSPQQQQQHDHCQLQGSEAGQRDSCPTGKLCSGSFSKRSR